MNLITTTKKVFRPIAVSAISILSISCNTATSTGKAVFSDFDYHVTAESIQTDTSKLATPLLPGCYPDPSIIRVGNDYYLVNSSFAFFPGVPIWHSNDLKNWERLGYVLNRPSQLSLPDSLNISAGIYAPDISYNPQNETFYMITTHVGNGGNFYVKTKNPKEGIWSDPVWLPQVGGIDPSILFDRDGKAYIVNNDCPEGEELYGGHRTIRIHDFDWKNDCVVGESTVIVNGGVNIDEKPIWIEGPHLYHIGEKYYLMCAEGGTGPDHREVIFESDYPKGPFKPCNINPILTQRSLSPDRHNAVTCAGHADLVEDIEGNWWAVFLGVRPYSADGHDIMGRETFIHPVRWMNGQPIVTEVDEALVWQAQKERENRLWSRDSLVNDVFFIRNPKSDFYSVIDNKLVISPSDVLISDRKSPAAIGRWVTESTFDVSVTLESFNSKSQTDFAGLILFQDDDCFIALGRSANSKGSAVVKLMAKSKNAYGSNWENVLPESDKQLKLRISSDGGGEYSFYYSVGDNPYDEIPLKLPADILSTQTAGNFTGTMVGVYATTQE